MSYVGPRSACDALDSLVNDISEPGIELLKTLGLPPDVEEEAVARLTEIIIAPFIGEDRTVGKLRQYIHDLSRGTS